MKCLIPEISWHNRDPVLSVDLQPVTNEFYRLATGGGDCHVLIWQLKFLDKGNIDIEVVTDLTRHQRSVNCVRWSPCGQFLASCDDDANIILWQRKTDNIPLLDGNTNDKETWIVYKVLRGHKEDVYDVCWSPNGLKLLSGSIDNTAIVWDFTKGTLEQILKDHKGFIQGVTWDPKNEFIATASSDRVCRIFSQTGKHIRARIYKGQLPVSEGNNLFSKEVKYFHDDTFKSYFRRLQFSPDGNLLVVPAGCVETEDSKKAFSATYIFTLDSFKEPAVILPTGKQSTVAIRFCPVLLELRSNGPDPIIKLAYRMVFAVATDTDIVLYDTQQAAPIACFQKVHYTRLTDLSWSADGLLLVASSTDGFCTLVTFENGELGIPYVKEESETEEKILDISGCDELDKEETETQTKETKIKKPNLLEQWTIKTPKRLKLCETTVDDKIPEAERKETTTSPLCSSKVNRLTPKRILPVSVTTVENNGTKPSATPPKPIAVKRKVKGTAEDPQAPPKSNSLLNFLRPSPNSKKAKSDICSSTITIDDEEANDAWKCQDDQKVVQNSEEVCMDLTEDSLADFKLEYSNSTIATTENEEDKLKLKECATNKENLTDVRTVEEVKDSSESNCVKVSKEIEQDMRQTANSTNTQSSPKSETHVQPKVPRRVPLITLSSPKSKKK